MKTDTPLESTLLALAHHEMGYVASLSLRRLFQQGLSSERSAAAVCLLFKGDTFLSSKILLTERSPDLPTHAGQVAFPGGLLEPTDGGRHENAALRECEEECGISLIKIKAVGRLPVFPTLMGKFDVTPILSVWEGESETPLKLSSEVTFAEWVSVDALFSSRQTEIRMVQDVEVTSPYFFWEKRKMWGVSAWIFDLLYQRYGRLG